MILIVLIIKAVICSIFFTIFFITNNTHYMVFFGLAALFDLVFINVIENNE